MREVLWKDFTLKFIREPISSRKCWKETQSVFENRSVKKKKCWKRSEAECKSKREKKSLFKELKHEGTEGEL